MIVLPRLCLAEIAAAAQRAWPDEGCGLLIGCRRPDEGLVRITNVAEAANVAPEELRRARFEVDPAARFLVMRSLRGSEEQLVGHWHSHPGGAAAPSAYDASQIFEPDLVWLIVSVADGRARDVTAWQSDADAAGFLPLPLQVVD